MTPPNPDLAGFYLPGFDLDDLDAFLASDRVPETCMQLSELDGFLTAIAIGSGADHAQRMAPGDLGRGRARGRE